MKTWRDYFKPIIRDCLKENAGRSEKEIKTALRERFASLGDIRGTHPLNIWRNEVGIQRGKRKPVGYRQPVASTLPQLFPQDRERNQINGIWIDEAEKCIKKNPSKKQNKKPLIEAPSGG